MTPWAWRVESDNVGLRHRAACRLCPWRGRWRRNIGDYDGAAVAIGVDGVNHAHQAHPAETLLVG